MTLRKGARRSKATDSSGLRRSPSTRELRLLRLPAKVQHDLKVGLVSVGHAKVLLGVEDPATQESLCDLIVKNGLSVRQLEDRIKALSKVETERKSGEPQELPDVYYRLLEHVGRYFGDNISVRRGRDGKGALTIRFDSDEQLEQYLKNLEQR